MEQQPRIRKANLRVAQEFAEEDELRHPISNILARIKAEEKRRGTYVCRDWRRSMHADPDRPPK